MFEQQREQAELRRLSRVKHKEKGGAASLGAEIVGFFKHQVQKRQTRFGKIADCWAQIIPPPLQEHCALESLVRGSLTVLVDSSSHLYDLKQLLLAGLEKQLLFACGSTGLRKIVLRSGRWYEGEEAGEKKIRFD